jgi:RNA polymerase sigma factor (TIGR02999 family)
VTNECARNNLRALPRNAKINSETLQSFPRGEKNFVAGGLQAEVTTLLDAIRAGKAEAKSRLVELVYAELRGLAAGLMRRERAGHTLQPTALVNEACLRLLTPEVLNVAQNRAHFFAAAARAMRHILVDHARQRGAGKRGGGQEAQTLDDVLDQFAQRNLDLVGVHDALTELAQLHERQSQVVELRFFSGYTMEEIAEQLQVSVTTVERDFRKACAFLHTRLVQDS